jgi:aminomethyltransferase
LEQLDRGPSRRRVGLLPEGRAPVRGGALLYAADDDSAPIGRITSGGFGPSVNAPVAMGYLPAALSAPGGRVFAELRGKRVPATIVTPPFTQPHYKRG